LVQLSGGEIEDARHLTEFWMVEPEMAYATLDDVMSLSERMLSYIAAQVLEKRSES
jgi:asparaginyl-tRNA synthetase